MENQDKNVSFFRFEDLRIYAKAIDYACWLTENFENAQNDAQKNLQQSFSHSSYDISLNIAEGSSRSKSQFEHYLKIAKTAIRECIVYSEVSYKIGIFTIDQYDRSRELLMELTRMIGALILSLQGRREDRREDRRDDFVADEPAPETDPLDSIDMNF